jgi:hypothetical protein
MTNLKDQLLYSNHLSLNFELSVIIKGNLFRILNQYFQLLNHFYVQLLLCLLFYLILYNFCLNLIFRFRKALN